MMVLPFYTVIFFWSTTTVHGSMMTDVSKLNDSLVQIWSQALNEVNSNIDSPEIRVVRIYGRTEIQLFEIDEDENVEMISRRHRYVFKQDVKKQVMWHVAANQPNPAIRTQLYDRCTGSLSELNIRVNLPGFYLYTDDRTTGAVNIIAVHLMNIYSWYDGTEPFSFTEQTTISNGKTLLLAFESTVYYNANSDAPRYNAKVEDIINQTNISIEEDDENLSQFFLMNNLRCRRHTQIFQNVLRSIRFVCMVDVTFQCPLPAGSSCWLENKRLYNIRLNIDGDAYRNDETVTVHIDV